MSVKTFSAHVVTVFRLIVSGKRFSTHEESRVVFSPFVKISRFDIGDIDLYPIFVKKIRLCRNCGEFMECDFSFIHVNMNLCMYT